MATWEFEGTPEYAAACYSLLLRAQLRAASNTSPALQKKERTKTKTPILGVKAEVIGLQGKTLFFQKLCDLLFLAFIICSQKVNSIIKGKGITSQPGALAGM